MIAAFLWVAKLLPARSWLILGALAGVLALFGAYKFQEARADRAVAEARQSKVTVEALDRVATQTPAIRSEQEEKQRAVDEIQGADQRLPDGFGPDLQRLRDRKDSR